MANDKNDFDVSGCKPFDKSVDNYYPVPKEERKTAPRTSCLFCKPYYDSFKDNMEKSSRHRGIKKRPRTPERFWNLEFDENDKMPPAEKYVFNTKKNRYINDEPDEKKELPLNHYVFNTKKNRYLNNETIEEKNVERNVDN